MKLLDKINTLVNRRIWGKYWTRVLPALAVLLLIINMIVYNYVSSYTEKTTEMMALEMAKLQADNFSKKLNYYVQTSDVLFQNLRNSDIESAMKRAKNYVQEHSDEFSYINITFENGKTYYMNGIIDSTIKIKSSEYKEIFDNKKKLFLKSPYSMSKPTGENYIIYCPIHKKNKIIGYSEIGFPRHIIDEPISKMKINGVGLGGLALSRLHSVAYFSKDSVLQYTTSFEECSKLGIVGLVELVDKAYEERDRNGKNENMGEYYTTHRGTTKINFISFFSFVKDTDIATIIIVPTIMLKINLLKLTAVLAITSIIVIILVFFILRRITHKLVIEPVLVTNTFTKEFASGNFYSINSSQALNAQYEFAELKQSVLEMKSKLTEAIQSIHGYTDDLMQSSEIFAESVSMIAEGSQTQSVSTEEISSSIENITSLIEKTNDNAEKTMASSENITKNIEVISECSIQTQDIIQNVIKKVNVINEITHRTDLLAINAAIEAARAGEHGKGFAVVATEIRKLAEICQKASKEINDISAESLSITENSVSLISNIAPKIAENAKQVNEISASCSEQLSITTSIAKAVEQLVDIATKNSRNSEKLAEYAQIQKANCQKLKDSVEFFKVDSLNSSSSEQLLSELDKHIREIAELQQQYALLETSGMK